MISRYQKTKGFTLIELLVVISIISLLSSIVLSSVSSARDKARIAAGKQFDSHNFSGFAADALGIWDFEGTDAATAGRDNSQYINNLTFSGVTFPGALVNGIKGNGLQFSGSNYAYSNNLIAFSGLGGFTFSAWIKTTGCSSYCRVLAFDGYIKDMILQNSSGNVLLVLVIGSTGNNLSAPIELNKWVHLAGTCIKTSTPKCNLYVNGKEVDSKTRSDITVFTGSPTGITIGKSRQANDAFFTGIIDEARIYSQSLIASNIQQLYAEGLPRHTLAEAD